MNDLIEALTIFAKYNCDKDDPTCCEHDKLCIARVTKEEISADDANRLDELGFFWEDENESWVSFRFGS